MTPLVVLEINAPLLIVAGENSDMAVLRAPRVEMELSSAGMQLLEVRSEGQTMGGEEVAEGWMLISNLRRSASVSSEASSVRDIYVSVFCINNHEGIFIKLEIYTEFDCFLWIKVGPG